jgi:hypothetical protein
MRIYGLIVLNGWFNGVVTIVDDGWCGCGGVVDGRKSGGWAALILSMWREGGCEKWGVGSANGLSMGREAFAVDLEVWGVVEFAYEI